MLYADLTSLISFIPQYIVATLIAIYVFFLLRKRRFYSRPEFRTDPFRLRSRADMTSLNFFSVLEKMKAVLTEPLLIPLSASGGSVISHSEFNTVLRKDVPAYCQPIISRSTNRGFKGPGSRVNYPEAFLRRRAYDLYSALFSILVWAGILLLLTPSQKIFIFIPHFSSLTVNLIVIIVLSIMIFEGSLATIYLFIGTTWKRAGAVMLSVLGLYSLSLLTPSFNWFRIYTTGGEIVIYSILAILLLSITFLISQLKEKRILFRLAYYSTVVAYVFFLSTTAYNIIITMMQL